MKKIVFLLSLLFCFVLLISCGNNTEQPTEDDYSNDVRHQYYLLAQTSGYTGTYEEWLASIAGKEIVLIVTSDNK